MNPYDCSYNSRLKRRTRYNPVDNRVPGPRMEQGVLATRPLLRPPQLQLSLQPQLPSSMSQGHTRIGDTTSSTDKHEKREDLSRPWGWVFPMLVARTEIV